MTSPLTTPDESQVVPDSSAPYPIIITPSGSVTPTPTPQMVDRLQCNTTDIGSSGGDVAIGNSAQSFPAVGWNQRIVFVHQAYIYAIGGAGFQVYGTGYISSPSGHGVVNIFSVINYIPGSVGDLWQGTIHGQAVAFVPAGDVGTFDLHMANPGTANLRCDGTHTGWWGISFPV